MRYGCDEDSKVDTRSDIDGIRDSGKRSVPLLTGSKLNEDNLYTIGLDSGQEH